MNNLDQAFEQEWSQAVGACRQGDLESAFRHLERAHVLGQRSTWRHVKSHFGMLRIGCLRGDRREVFGQIGRLLAAALFSRIWVPVGNTGGANVSAFKPMPVPPDLQRLLSQDGR